ncbi:PspC domain-containing protein [Microbacterium gorillae]|uniref:PspC domain-containing protein n=1 Tax=Microbacterium gorillae TaxID=1231063 RepID=UPI0005911D07|nr:PspC domain-containing protein [Microbacterium gorillae]
MTDTSVPPAPTTPPPPAGSGGFFGWVRSLGIVRQDAWIGGVAAGIARRIGVDPLIIRGIFVVTALIGFPALLIYAICWALLPDADGEIHLQNMFRGRFSPPMVAIIVVVLLSIVPIVPWFFGAVFWPYAGVVNAGWTGIPKVFTVLLVLGLLALLIVAIVKASQHRNRATTPTNRQSGPGSHTWQEPTPSAAPFAAATAPSSQSRPQQQAQPQPPVQPQWQQPQQQPQGPAYEAWRQQHEAWLAQHGQWRRDQDDADRRAQEQARQENIARVVEQKRAYDRARAVRKASRPRTPFWYVAIVVGLAVLAGAATALATAGLGSAAAAGACLCVAAGVTALGMIGAGILRRRSGFLTFLTIAILVFAVPVSLAVVPLTSSTRALGVSAGDAGEVALFGGDMNIYNPEPGEHTYVQFSGSTTIQLSPYPEQAGKPQGNAFGSVVLAKGQGVTDIWVDPGVRLDLTAVVRDGQVRVFDAQGAEDPNPQLTAEQPDAVSGPDGLTYDTTLTNPDKGSATVDVTVRIGQRDTVNVYLIQPTDTTEKDGK